MFFNVDSESDNDSIPDTFERFHGSGSLTDNHSYSSDNAFKFSPNQQLQNQELREE